MMEKTTQLDKIKKTAIAFLYMDVKETKFSPMIVQHPIFESAFQPYKGENEDNPKVVNILDCPESELKMVNGFYTSIIRNCSTASAIMIHIRKPYRLAFLKHIKSFLSNEDFSKLLADVWISSENPNGDVNVSIFELTKWFKEADKIYLMNEKERTYIENLPEEITVYRGVSVKRNPNGLSYTDDPKTAKWFKERFEYDDKKGYIITGTIKKKDILAYFNDGREHEIVVARSALSNEKKIDDIFL